MKTSQVKNKATSISHSSKPFFDKSGEGSFFLQNKGIENLFFTPSIIQSKFENSDEEQSLQKKRTKEEEQVFRKSIFESEHESTNNPVQTKNKNSTTSNQLNSNSNTMPADVQSSMENSFGVDFSNVNIHTNSKSASNIGALAYTQGNDIHFAQGKFNPHTQGGKELIGHELTHVVQQREGRVKPSVQAKGLSINADKGLEKEADHFGKKAANGEKIQMKSSNRNGGNTSSIQLKSANDVIQLATEVDTDYGKFKHTKYSAIGTNGVDIELEFHPDKTKVDAEKIGLTQSVRSILGGKGVPINPTIKEKMIKSGTKEGNQIDQHAEFGNPLYATGKESAGDKLGDTATNSSWGQHATKKANGDWKPAKLIDGPTLPGHGNNSGQEFETAALALEGKQSGLYMGSVKWGWTYKNNVASFKKIKFDLVSKGDPSSDFFDTAKAWNKAHTAGTLFTKGGLNSGKDAQVYDSAHSPSMTIKNNTVVTLINTSTRFTHIHNNKMYAWVDYVDSAGTSQKGVMKMDDLFDKGDGGNTIDLPITWTGTIQLDPSKGKLVGLRPGKGKGTGLYADLPVGASVKVIDDSSAWLKVQVDPTQAGIVLNKKGKSAIGGDGKIIGYLSKELVKK